jgi:hypothetical protein
MFRYRITGVWGDIPYKLNQVLIETTDQGEEFKRLHYPVSPERIYSTDRKRSAVFNMTYHASGGFLAVRVKTGKNMKYYEITSVDSGKTQTLSEAQARNQFGKDEWLEIKQNFLPHLVVAEVDKPRKAKK